MKSLKLFSLLLVAVPSVALAATTTLTPDADTYTRSGKDAGNADLLDIRGFGGNDFMGYIRFDLSGLNIATITDATYTLSKVAYFRNDTIVAGRFANFGLLDDAGNTPQNWDEQTLAEGNLGAEYGGGSPSTLVNVFNLDADRGADVIETVDNNAIPQSLSGTDLVAFLNDRVANGGLVTFISAIDATGGRGWGYGTKENADQSLWPTLQISYTMVPEPTAVALIGLGMAGILARRRLGAR